MIAHLHQDMVVYSTETADDLFILSNFYINAKDEASIKLKNSYFAVMVHGLAGSAIPGNADGQQIDWYFADFAERIKYDWKYKGKNRAILLLCCYAGFGMVRPLARKLQLPVVAGRSAVTLESNGTIMCVQMADASRNPANRNLQVGNRLDWIFASPSGQMEISSGSTLDKNKAVSFADRFKSQ